jgi:phosphoglycolate phosphatase-like HAD superfamily hydrolase
MGQPFEIVRPAARRGPFRAAVLDFDGTTSLLREGWARIMAELGRDHLADAQLVREPEAELLGYLEREMLMLSGKPSIFQMRRLADEVSSRGGPTLDPDAMLVEFLRRLTANIATRIDDLKAGAVPTAAWTVPGTHALLDELLRRGASLYLVSGTDRGFVESDLELLDLARYFGRHVYCPSIDTPNFSKRDVIAALLRDEGFAPAELLGFGDGYAETVEVRAAGGVAVGVASTEPPARLNDMKREMLIQLGADVIVPDYRDHAALLAWLWGED